MQVLNPASIQGTPQSMPTNNWWDGITSIVDSSAKAAASIAANYTAVRQQIRTIQSSDVPAQNRPPGTFGLNPQAAGVAGGTPEGSTVFGLPAGALAVAALVLVAVVALARKK